MLAEAKCSPALSANGGWKARTHPLGDAGRRRLVGDLLEQHDELVAAEARDGVARAQGAFSRGATSISNSSPAAWPRLSLTSLKLSRSRQHDRDFGLRSRERVREAVHEQHAVGKACQRVVQRLVADVVFAGSLLQRVGEDVCERLHEVGVSGGEARLGCGGQRDRAPAAFAPVDLARDRTGAETVQGGHAKSGAHDRSAGVVGPFEHGAAVHAENLRGRGERVVHQHADLHSLQRTLAQSRDRGLLSGAALELELGELAIGHVGDHSVPHRATVPIGDERGFVAHPHGPSVAVEDPIFLRQRRLADHVLAPEHAVAVLWVHLTRPQPGVGHPLRGREAEYVGRARADVVPRAAHADVGHVENRREAVEQGSQGGLAALARRVASRPAPVVSARWLWCRRHPAFVIGVFAAKGERCCATSPADSTRERGASGAASGRTSARSRR